MFCVAADACLEIQNYVFVLGFFNSYFFIIYFVFFGLVVPFYNKILGASQIFKIVNCRKELLTEIEWINLGGKTNKFVFRVKLNKRHDIDCGSSNIK